jgi:hypothetical protein
VSRRAVVAVTIAAVAAGGILGSALVMRGPAQLNLSANANHRHHRDNPGMMNGQPMGGQSMNSQPMNGQQMNGQAMPSQMMAGQRFTTVDNQTDATFNQLLGINNSGLIAGYFGSGAQGHPNKGYELILSHRMTSYRSENFPHALQTQVTGLNDNGVTVGFWSSQNTASMMNNNFGFYAWGGHFHSVNFPAPHNSSPPVNQLLGVNDRGVAVGFYTNSQGNNRGYEFNIFTHQFSRVLVPGSPRRLQDGPSLTAAAINNRGDVAGFYTAMGGMTDAFLRKANGVFIKLAYPGAAMTQAFGVNDRDEVVGGYTTGSGNAAKTFGFTWTPGSGFTSVSDPQGQGATTLNGVNNAGALVGFYTDMAGNTHGMVVAAMRHHMPRMGSPMPTTSPSMMMGTPRPTMSMSPMAAPSASTMPASPPAPTSTAAPSHW